MYRIIKPTLKIFDANKQIKLNLEKINLYQKIKKSFINIFL